MPRIVMSPRLQQVYKAALFQRQQWSKYRREREWFWRFMGMNPGKLHVEELNINSTFGKTGSYGLHVQQFGRGLRVPTDGLQATFIADEIVKDTKDSPK